MSGSRWVITPSWLPGSLRSFLYSSSVYSCHLFSVSLASVYVHTVSVLYCMKWFLGIYNFLKEVYSLFLLFSPISFHWSQRKAFFLFFLVFGTLHSDRYIFPFLLCFSLLFSQLFVTPPQTTICLFCISFSWEWFWSLTLVQCHKPQFIVTQTILSLISNPLNLVVSST